MKVREIMATRVVTVTPDTPVPVIAGLLRDNRISGVPVTDADGAALALAYRGGPRTGRAGRDVHAR